MPAFQYTALSQSGKQRKGILEGDTAKAIRAQLREQSLIPVDVVEIKDRKSTTSRGNSIATKDLALTTRELSTMVDAGIPLEESLRAVGEQASNARIKSILFAVRGKVLEGHSLATGLNAFPNAFDGLFRSTVKAGESSGRLGETLTRLADFTEAREKLKQSAINAIIYPCIILVLAFAMIGLMLMLFVPRMEALFARQGGELPLPTQIVVSISDFMLSNWWLFAIVLPLLVIATMLLLRLPKPKRIWHGIILRIPGIGSLSRGLNAARFTRTLAILQESSVPILDGMQLASAVCTNVVIREQAQHASKAVREGASLNQALDNGELPPMVVSLIANGEASGRLEAMLYQAAETLETQTDNRITRLLALLNPLLMIFVGLTVGFIALSIMMPLMESVQTLGR